jgi:hypothetical protein
MSIKMNRVLAAGAIATLSLISGISFAASATTNGSGSACLPDADDYSFFRNSTGFTNNAGATRDVHCPVLHNTTFEQLSDTDIFVDIPANSTVTCYLRAMTNTGSIIAEDSGSTTSDVVGADVDFDAVELGSGFGSYYSLRCSLPNSGRIISYRYIEADV